MTTWRQPEYFEPPTARIKCFTTATISGCNFYRLFFQMSKTSEPRLVCGFVPEAEVVDSSSIRISNRFGETMQIVLNFLEWGVGLFYEIHFPTTLQATAKEVRDPKLRAPNT
jgi:hypothetical protein